MDIPEAMLMTQCRQMLDDFSRRMQSQGLSMDQYFQFTGMTADKMMEDMKPQALKRIQTRLVLEKVAEVENIQPTEEEVNEEISKMAEAYKMEADKLKESMARIPPLYCWGYLSCNLLKENNAKIILPRLSCPIEF